MSKKTQKTTIELSQNATTVLERRYLCRDKEGKVLETPLDMFERVAKTIAAGEKEFKTGRVPAELAKEFLEMMTNLEFMPNSPTLMNAGRELGQLSACFVLPIGDSMEEIFEASFSSVFSAALLASLFGSYLLQSIGIFRLLVVSVGYTCLS